jgi:hypothetical protein
MKNDLWVVDNGGIADMQTQAAILQSNIGTPREWVAVGIADDEGFAAVVALCHPDNAKLIASAGKLVEALGEVQTALACYRDEARYVNPEHGIITLEELKYLVVDPLLESIGR